MEATSGNGSLAGCTVEDVDECPGVFSLSSLLAATDRKLGSIDRSLSFPFEGLANRIEPGLVTGTAGCSATNTRLAGVWIEVSGVPSGLRPSWAAF